MLDPSEHLAVRLASDGDPEPIQIEDTETTFAIGWKGQYRIEGSAFVYMDGDTGRATTILGYPTEAGSDGVISVDCHRPSQRNAHRD
jgi:hypothetical protein